EGSIQIPTPRNGIGAPTVRVAIHNMPEPVDVLRIAPTANALLPTRAGVVTTPRGSPLQPAVGAPTVAAPDATGTSTREFGANVGLLMPLPWLLPELSNMWLARFQVLTSPGTEDSSMFMVAAISAAVRANGHRRTSSISPFHSSMPGALRSPLP